MTRFVLRRLGHGVLVAALVTITVFFVTRILTDPTKLLLPIGSSEEQRDSLRHSLGLDAPLLSQFGTFLREVVFLNFGESAWQRRDARALVLERLPATFALVAAGTITAVVIFIPLGVVAAMRQNRWADRCVSLFSLAGLSLPQFWVGTMLIWLFAVKLGWLPTSGRGGLNHLVLPALTLALTSGGRLALTTRATLIEELHAPYVEAALAKGLSRRRVVVRHVLRNALIPVVTLTMWEVANNMAGAAVVVETVFAWPGIGRLLIDAVRFNDIYLIQAIVFITALLIVGANFVTDVIYKIADPRLEVA